MKKRLGAAFLAFCMAFGMMPGMALAAEKDHEHSMGEGIITKSATCTEEGETTYTCTDPECDATRTETIEKLEHKPGTDVENNEDGTHSFTCTVCGEELPEACDYSGGGVVTGVTCTEDGVRTYTCPVCSSTKTEKVLSTGHNYKKDSDGNYKCNECGIAIPASLTAVYEDVVRQARTYNVNTNLDLAGVANYIENLTKNLLDSSYYAYDVVDVDVKTWNPDEARNVIHCTYTVFVDIDRVGRFTTQHLTMDLNVVDNETNYISVLKADNGEIIPSVRYAEQGERVTLTAHPESGYELDKLTVSDIRGRTLTVRDMGSGRYSFTMPNSRVTVDASFVSEGDEETPASTVTVPGTNHTAQQPGSSEVFTGLGTPGISGIVLNPTPMTFSDVRPGDWYYDSVDYVWKHYLMSGVSETQFDPNTTTSRAMTWTIMARMNNIRTDINPGATWYDRGMVWAKENGITDGSDPMGNITREQLAAMLWRQAGSPSGAAADLSQYSDVGSVSSYAQSAVRWAVANGILNGSDGKLNPQGTATRAQVAAMVARYGDKIA